ncbi:MAG: nickel-responsive transcriptional regulator NikR [Kiritimatiellae bacterium]|nr:nickel-responsive transcriptional regulator NikR [Kiritimatiellia bacterium]
MSDLTRFSVSLDKSLLDEFDKQTELAQYPTRSKAIADLIINSLVKKLWSGGKTVSGAIILVYDHHKRGLTNKLTHIQHDFHNLIISSQHIHMDHHNCMEIVVVKGKPRDINNLTQKLKATKGVKHGSLAMATTGNKM